MINTYSGHENKVKHNLEHRVQTMSQNRNVRQVVVPTEQVSEMKDGQKEPDRETDDARLRPGQHGDDRRRLGPGQEHPRRDRLRRLRATSRCRSPNRRSTACCTARPPSGPRTQAQFSIGESVKVISGPLSDFSGEIAEINEDAAKLKVLVSIFGRETPVEVGYDQVKKI